VDMLEGGMLCGRAAMVDMSNSAKTLGFDWRRETGLRLRDDDSWERSHDFIRSWVPHRLIKRGGGQLLYMQ
jgi:hypothetical protein